MVFRTHDFLVMISDDFWGILTEKLATSTCFLGVLKKKNIELKQKQDFMMLQSLNVGVVPYVPLPWCNLELG